MASVGSEGESLSLNLTPMLDIFSILVTFLLMSYSTDPTAHDVNADVELPDSATVATLDEIPAIVVTKSDILVNDKKITTIVNGDVPEADRSQGAIMPVYRELQKISEMNKQVAARLSPEKKAATGRITMEMHKEHNFKLTKRIMLSAQQAEFITFNLVVNRTGD